MKRFPNAIVGVDAPLEVKNTTGNRDIEINFLRDYSSKRLGAYPVNRQLLTKNHNIIVGEKLCENVVQVLGETIFEVYPHATIMNCFHGNVLPYKRKKGRNVAFIKEQLKILENYISSVVHGEIKKDLNELKGLRLKHYEDMLDAIVCAYTLYYCEKNEFKLYGDILKIPL